MLYLKAGQLLEDFSQRSSLKAVMSIVEGTPTRVSRVRRGWVDVAEVEPLVGAARMLGVTLAKKRSMDVVMTLFISTMIVNVYVLGCIFVGMTLAVDNYVY